MSFASDCKDEASQIKIEHVHCKMAALESLLRSSSEIIRRDDGFIISFTSQNSHVAGAFMKLVKELYHADINLLSKAIVFESEKSALKYASYFGIENDISVACCGFNLSLYQVELLLNNNAKEIVIAFDRDFSEKGDEVFKKQVKYLKSLHKRYHNDVLISFIFDKHMKLSTKDSPIDRGKELFLELFKERIIL